jgi:hypothetical protein
VQTPLPPPDISSPKRSLENLSFIISSSANIHKLYEKKKSSANIHKLYVTYVWIDLFDLT